MNALKIVKGDTVTLKYQLTGNGQPKDITGMGFKFTAREKKEDAAAVIGPVAGVVDDAVNGKFSITLSAADTGAVFTGVYEVSMFDPSGARTTLTPAGGSQILVIEDIYS